MEACSTLEAAAEGARRKAPLRFGGPVKRTTAMPHSLVAETCMSGPMVLVKSKLSPKGQRALPTFTVPC